MADPRFYRLQPQGTAPTTREFVEVQARLERVLNGAASTTLWGNAVLLEDVVLTVNRENLVEHGLGREFTSWLLCDRTSSVVVWRYAASTVDLSLYLPLVCSLTSTVDLVVF